VIATFLITDVDWLTILMINTNWYNSHRDYRWLDWLSLWLYTIRSSPRLSLISYSPRLLLFGFSFVDADLLTPTTS
jgi:hypothetical protein